LARILVVEDEVDTRMVLGKFLTVAGHEVIPAANGWEALLVLDTTSVDLILLDVMMPGMDGVTFLNILRNAQTKRNTPVVIVTAMSSQELSTRFRDLSVQAILPKTQELFEELMQTVHKILPDPQDGKYRRKSDESRYTARDRF